MISTSLFIFFLNFFIISELTPFCKIASKQISQKDISINPITLLEKQELLQINNSYIDLKTTSHKSKAKDLIFIMPNKSANRLTCLTAKNINLEKNNLIGKDIAIISFLTKNNTLSDTYDDFILENQKEMSFPAEKLSSYMKKRNISLGFIHLPTKLLFAQKNSVAIVEIIRRAALSFSAFSFTFIGICFGMEINRIKSSKKLLTAAFFSILILLSFIIGKSFKNNLIISSLFYIVPQPLILLFSMNRLKNISKGIE